MTTPLDAQYLRELFGEMVRNAQAFDRLLRHSTLQLDEADVAGFVETLSHLSAVTAQQTAKLHVMSVEQGIDRRGSERRTTHDRRWRP